MGADLYLDDDFSSGIPGCPGTRFVLRLNQAPLELESGMVASRRQSVAEMSAELTINRGGSTNSLATMPENPQSAYVLPQKMTLLFVDDDSILRRMFCRTVKAVVPSGWTIRQASDGETALRLFDDGESFDIVFMDHYMASHNKQMLGTETVQALRARGVDSIICGLSANDKEEEFRQAGADAFMFKPFPCQNDALRRALWQVIQSRPQNSAFDSSALVSHVPELSSSNLSVNV